MNDKEKLAALSATILSSTATFAAMVQMLRKKNILSEMDEREMYEQAILMLGAQQGNNAPKNPINELAQNLIRSQLA